MKVFLLLGLALLAFKTECTSILSRRGLINAQTVFDVMKYGAKANGRFENAMAIMQAWNAACQSTGPAKLLIPPGDFAAGEVILQGPCSNRVTIEIQGNLLAQTDISLFTSGFWITIQEVDGIVIRGTGTINGRGKSAWQYADDGDGPHLPVSLLLQEVQNSVVENLHFVDSKGFHLKVTDSKGVSLRNLKIAAPRDSPNTDGVHISDSANVNVTDSVIGTGDDCVSIGDNTTNIFVSRITCGPGHGISVGSLGKREDEMDVKGVIVRNCTLTGTTNGVRIKTYRASPSLQASGILFEDIVMNVVKNPIIIDQQYNSKKKKEPSKVKIRDVHFRNIRGTTVSKIPINVICSEAVPCEGVEFVNIDLSPAALLGRSALSAVCQNAKLTVVGKLNPTGCQ